MKKLITILFIVIGLLSCKSPEARKPISKTTGVFFKKSAERNKKLNKKEQQQFQKIMSNNTTFTYIASQNGFWYYYNTKIEQASIMPKFGDIINFNYSIKDINENEIYSEEDLGTINYIMDKEELFTGLREGLKLMKPTETVTFLFPSQKAFGYYGDSNKIGINIPLICKVTLNTITQNQND
jgi:gliding motility-associated peptidyl-prolyl isomerase